MATVAAAMIARARREIQHHFFSADAVRPDRAVEFEPANGIERRQFDYLVSRGIVRQTEGGRWWLDVVAYDVQLRARHRRVRSAMLVLIALLLLALLLGGTMGSITR